MSPLGTPIADFVRQYAAAEGSRLHMPGHKGRGVLGCEPFDITEVWGADELYDAQGIIARSEANAARLFGTAATIYGTEGSSQSIRAMVYLAASRASGRPWLLAARNAHKAFLYACALCDCDVQWLYPQSGESLCACPVTARQVEEALSRASQLPAAVYLTSPDYLGGIQDIAGISAVCRRYGVLLLVDNAHGAYLRFLPEDQHPITLGADLCCDSAHKTLPVLTGGAYLHLKDDAFSVQEARQAMCLFGSTSPSYLILQSLDLCNPYLAEGFAGKLSGTVERICRLAGQFRAQGWQLRHVQEPCKLVLAASASGATGQEVAHLLRRSGIECEYADNDYVVLMFSPENPVEDYSRVLNALGQCPRRGEAPTAAPALPHGQQVVSIRQAVMGRHRLVPLEAAAGKICGLPTVSCPPAIPIVVSGERITPEAAACMAYYGIHQVEILDEN